MNNRFGLLSIALMLLHLSPGIAHADRCTGDQILRMMDQGFTKEEVMKLCGPAEEIPPEAPKPPDQASLASLAGTWEGHRVDGAFIRYAIFPDGKFNYQVTDLDGRAIRIWGTLDVTPLKTNTVVLQVKPEGWEPEDFSHPYKQGLISAPVNLPDANTMVSSVFTLKRVSN